MLKNKRYDLYYYLVSVGTVKYGFWTLFAILFYRDYFLSPDNRILYAALFISHFAMMLQPMVILHKVRVRGWFIAISLLWAFTNDYFDYIIGVHPWVPQHSIDTLMWATISMSVGATMLLYCLMKKIERPILMDF